MKSLLKCLALVGTAAAFAVAAHATIIGGAVTGGSAFTAGGVFVSLAPPIGNPFGAPNSVGNNTFQNPNLYGFNEDQNVFVGPSALLADEVAGGGPGSIAAGVEVASHYIFFDPVSNSQIGWVDFDAKILAVIKSTANLLASDYLANTGVNYLNPTARGLEPSDSATIDSLLNYRLNVDWVASSPGDYVRVLTEHSPRAVPDSVSTLALLGGALLSLTALRRRFIA